MLQHIDAIQTQVATVLATRLTTARQAKKYGQDFVANCIGISGKSISSYERGVAFPPIQTLASLACLYDVSLDWLCGLSPLNDKIFNIAQMENSVSMLTTNIASLKKLLQVDTSNMQITYEIRKEDQQSAGV